MTAHLLLVLCLGLLAAPAAAAATVIPQQGMKGVRVGMTVAEVREKLGKPSREARVRHEIVGRAWRLDYGLTVLSFDGPRESSRLITLSTTSRRERLADGVGVGSTRAAADRVPRVRCDVFDGFDHCFIGEFTAGRIVTDFHISSRGRVKRIVVGRVID